MTAPTLKTNEHLKKTNEHMFLSSFSLKSFFHTFVVKKKIILYLESKQNLCVQKIFHTVMTVQKVAKI